MKLLTTLVLALAIVSAPYSVSAASLKPSITLTLPTKGASYNRTEKMPVHWTLENITRTLVVVTEIKLIKRDTKGPSVGYVGGSGSQHTVYAGNTEGGFTVDWGLNNSIPGKYAITSELRECNKKGCDQAPAGKRIGKKTKKLYITIRNDGGWTSNINGSSDTSIELISPNGGEEYVAGSGKTFKIRWEATNVPKGSKVCALLERQGGRFFSFPPCKTAKNGKGYVTVKLIQNAGYDLGPDEYWAHVSIGATSVGGKDGATLAEDVSDESFTLE